MEVSFGHVLWYIQQSTEGNDTAKTSTCFKYKMKTFQHRHLRQPIKQDNIQSAYSTDLKIECKYNKLTRTINLTDKNQN